MGSSTVIAHGLLTIVGVLLASIFGVYIISRVGYVNNSLSMMINSKIQELQIDVKIVAGYYNSTESKYVVYVKNVGMTSIPLNQLYGKTEIYVISYDGNTYFFKVDSTTASNVAEVKDLNNDGEWSVGETLVFKLSFTSRPSEPLRVKLVLPSGAYTEEMLPG